MPLLVCCLTISASAVEQEKAKVSEVDGHLIPDESKSEWDFRGDFSKSKLAVFFDGK